MQIDTKKLKNFLNKATLNGVIRSAVLKITDKKMNIWVRSADNSIVVCSELNNVESENAVWPLRDINIVLNALTLFDGIIEIVQSNNILSIFNKVRQLDIVLAEESFIENKLDKKINVEYEKKVTLPGDIWRNILKTKAVVKADVTTITVQDKILTISVGGKSADKFKETVACDYDNLKVEFGIPLDEVLVVLGDKLEVGMKTNFPISLREVTADYDITFVVAPYVEQQ
jgi:hypothetical protein